MAKKVAKREQKPAAAAPDVLIAGAGPTGLFLAYLLKRHGINFRIIAAAPGPATQSRAMVVHARTLEFYRMLGLAEEALALGQQVASARFHVNGEERASFSFNDMGKGLSAFPFALTLPQDVHERFLVDKLKALGVEIEWNTRLLSFDQDQDGVTAIIEADDQIAKSQYRYLIGADGATSIVRRVMGVNFSGGTTHGLFYVADVEATPASSDIQIGVDGQRALAMFPAAKGVQRLIGMAKDDEAGNSTISFDDVKGYATQLMGITPGKLNWFATYHVHHRVADHFHRGRCFLAGDAGHVHSPVGGQGMNTGLGDAMNLGWKLAEVLKGTSKPSLLDSYEPERIPFARALVATTDRAFELLMAQGLLARFIRLHVFTRIVNTLTRFEYSRKALFRTVSQIRIAYRKSPLSLGGSASLKAGDRLPWLATADNYAGLDGMGWQIHIFGTALPGLAETAATTGLKLVNFNMTDEARAAGFATGTVYLVRPDAYLALVADKRAVQVLRDYLAKLAA